MKDKNIIDFHSMYIITCFEETVTETLCSFIQLKNYDSIALSKASLVMDRLIWRAAVQNRTTSGEHTAAG